MKVSGGKPKGYISAQEAISEDRNKELFREKLTSINITYKYMFGR